MESNQKRTKMENLKKNEMIIIDSVGGKHEQIWVGKCCGALKRTHYKMPPCVLIKDCDEYDKNSDRKKVL